MPTATKKVKIGAKQYPVAEMGSLDRSGVRRLRELVEAASALDGEQDATKALAGTDVLWDLAALLVPSAPQDVIDSLSIDEVAGIVMETGALTGSVGGITLGESSASTDS